MTPRRRGERGAAFAYAGLDRVMHEKARLSILTALLARPEGVLFPELKELCGLTDGNLSRHVTVLQEARLVEVWKGQEGPRSKTLIRMSQAGRRAFVAYLDELERVIRDARAEVRGDAWQGRGNPAGDGYAPA
ncbi:MAG: transcriptional regulator [Planctomycetes bacterium]|nr:transcriptional regulator [Planctomycetota bacterium]